ncbi:MAG: hypothetical protein IPK32_21935 [Verrucomicrobiaceae bacterium]|nr:hypothetical protein [Verrucomicrobiaceae bacterium]
MSLRIFAIVLALGTTALQATQPLRIVGTGARIAYTRFTTSGTATAFWQRTPHVLGGPVAELDIGFMNWLHSTTAEVQSDSAVTLHFAWITRASTGQVVPLTFAGQRQLSMPANSTQAYFLADAIPSSTWTGAAPARDEIFWVYAKGSVATAGSICLGTPSTYSGARFAIYDPVNDPGTKDFAGALPSITGQNARTDALPMVFLGRYTGPGHLSVIGVGDSIMSGTGDTANPVPVISGYGFFNRAAVDAGGANAIAMMNISRHGEAAANWVSSHGLRQQLLAFGNVAVEEYGTNDIGSNGGSANVTNIYNRLVSVWGNIRTAGVQHILRTRLLPRTTSASGNWISLADQTPNPGWGAGGARDQINSLFTTALSEGKIDTVVDSLTAVQDPADDHCWISTGAADYATSDGTHARSASNALIAPVLRDALLATKVDDYAAWAATIPWGGADRSATADPNADSVPNLLAYALDAPGMTSATTFLPQAQTDTTTSGGPWLSFTYRKTERAADLIHSVQTSTTLSGWAPVTIDGVNFITETAHPDPDGDGSCVLIRVRIRLQASDPVLFVRLQVTQAP